MLQSVALFSTNRVSHMSKIDFAKIFAAGLKGISRLIIEFPSIEQKIFVKALRDSLANTARNLHPNEAVSVLAHKTGLLREQINDALDNDCPVAVMDTESIILSDLWRLSDDNKRMPIYGKDVISFHSIAMKQLKGKHSIPSVLESLVESGSVKKEGDDLIVLSNIFVVNKSAELVINEIGSSIRRLIDTVLNNIDIKREAKRYQYSYKSTKIPLSSRNEYHARMYKLSQKHMEEYKEVIEEFEAEVPNGNYPECGISVFEFDEKENNKGKNNE